jgi:hypothetical protein
MSIGATSSQALGNVSGSEISVATARLALKQQSIEGEGAVRLIQQAGKVNQGPADPARGRNIDIFA